MSGMAPGVSGNAPGHLGGVPFELLAAGGHALFLDFDGTLVELAERPEDVVLAPGLLDNLGRLQALLNGRLAVVSGRPIEQIDAMLGPLRLPVAGIHGLERRAFDGSMHRGVVPNMDLVLKAASELVGRHSGLWLEAKNGALALHYRQAPKLGPLCDAAMLAAVRACPGTVLLQGKMVAEVKPAGFDKGTAIAAFMSEAPFAGSLAAFAGDDITDEAGFAMVQQQGGAGIKVGRGVTLAQFRIASPATLAAALAQLVHTLSRSAA